MTKEYITWNKIEKAIDVIDEKIPKELKNQVRGIYGIPRGGLIPAVMLSHRLKIPIFEEPRVRPIFIVDDIADTGKTLKSFRNLEDVYIITLFYHIQSITIPDFWAFEKQRGWQVYPWESK